VHRVWLASSSIVFLRARLGIGLRSCFFFFQAEDGIRDRNVTGVQTCALPIYDHDGDPEPFAQVAQQAQDLAGGGAVERAGGLIRSEERRVGKEGRARWGPEREKEKEGRGKRSERTLGGMRGRQQHAGGRCGVM